MPISAPSPSLPQPRSARTTYYTPHKAASPRPDRQQSDAGAWGNLLSGNNTPNAAGNSTISFVLNPTDTNLNPVNTGPLTVYSFLGESYQPLVARVISSVPGQILSSGNMALDASTTLTNDKVESLPVARSISSVKASPTLLPKSRYGIPQRHQPQLKAMPGMTVKVPAMVATVTPTPSCPLPTPPTSLASSTPRSLPRPVGER